MNDLLERELNPLKVLRHIDRLRALAEGRDVAPVTVEIDPVAFCNHACAWCVDPAHAPVTMSEALFERLIAELAGFDVGGFRAAGIVFKGGGEPTLHPGFGAMVERATARGFAVGVVTNGSRLRDWASVLGRRAAYVRVSIDGPTPESHARLHRSNDFARVLEGVRGLMAAREQARHPVVGLTFAMDIHTVSLAGEAIALGAGLGVDYVLLRPPFFEEVGRMPTMTLAEAREVRERIQAAAAAYEGPLAVQVGNWMGDAEQAAGGISGFAAAGRRDLQARRTLPIEHRTGRCSASPLLAVVTASGELFGCCNLRGLPAWSMGRLDYDAGKDLAALWHGRDRAAVLRRMHRTECLRHCTHPLARYNEMIEALRPGAVGHTEFV